MIKKLDTKKLMNSLVKFQVHPRLKAFKCPDCAIKLVGKEVDETVILVCTECEYTQTLCAKEMEIINFFVK
jgi:transcription elongation factor Elf1